MINARQLSIISLALALPCGLCLAEKNAELKPALIKPEKTVLDEQFSGAELGKPFVVAKGTWRIADGVLVGAEKKEDQHAAVLNCQIPNRDSAIRFSFKLEGATAFHLSFNRAKGHLFRVIVTPQSVALSKDKDKNDTDSKPLLLAKAQKKIEPGQWHTMLVEVQGGKVNVQLDNGVVLRGENADLATDKPNYRFIVRGSSVELDDLKIWQVTP